MGFNVMAGYWQTLYTQQTDAELVIEPAVAALGIPYRFQHPFYLWGACKYFPDFLLPTIGVILEVDDPSHDNPEKQEADAQRTSALKALGYSVVRCTNDEAENDPNGVVARLIAPLLTRKGPGLPKPVPRKRRPKPRKRPKKRKTKEGN